MVYWYAFYGVAASPIAVCANVFGTRVRAADIRNNFIGKLNVRKLFRHEKCAKTLSVWKVCANVTQPLWNGDFIPQFCNEFLMCSDSKSPSTSWAYRVIQKFYTITLSFTPVTFERIAVQIWNFVSAWRYKKTICLYPQNFEGTTLKKEQELWGL